MQSLLGLSRTFDTVPALRDQLCTADDSDQLAVRVGRRRSDAIVFAVDRQQPSGASILTEAQQSLDRGTPVFVLLMATSADATSDLWATLDGRCVVLDALADDIDCADRIRDAVGDHLFGLLSPDLEPNTISRFGEWLHADLAHLGVASYRTYRRMAEQAGSESDYARMLIKRADAADSLAEGDVGESVQILRRLAADFQPDWSSRYSLGRLLAARGHTGDEAAEALVQLDRAFYAVAHQAHEMDDLKIGLSQASCLLAMIRVKRRRFDCDAAQSDLNELGTLPIASDPSVRRALEVEQIRLHGRRGADGLADARAGLIDLLWRSPETVISLTNSMDLAVTRDQLGAAVVAAIGEELGRAARAVVRPAPRDRPGTPRAAVAAARAFAEESIGQLRRRFELVEGLIDWSVDPPRWLVDRLSEEVAPLQTEVEEQEDVRRRVVATGTANAGACGVSPVIFEAADLTPVEPPEPVDTVSVRDPAAIDAQRVAVRESLERARTRYRNAHAKLAKLQRDSLRKPERLSNARIGVGVVAALLAVVFFVAVVKHPGFLIGVGICLGVVAICFGPAWAAARRYDQDKNDIGEAQMVVDSAAQDGRPLVEVVKTLDRLPGLDERLAEARTVLARSTDRLRSAERARDEAAAVVKPGGDSALDFVSALVERTRAFNRAFTVHPHLWWPTFVDQRPAQPGDQVRVDEASDAQWGLLSGWPGDRLVRVSIDDDVLAVSDVWNVFPEDGRRAILLEQGLRSFLEPKSP